MAAILESGGSPAPAGLNSQREPTQPGADDATPPWWHVDSTVVESRVTAWLGLAVVVGLAVLLYTWGLARNGYANQYYAAAVLSMSQSWKAFFFGSIDAVGFITADKPPFALWVQALSARLLGFGSWSILLPQAAAGVATVAALGYLARRTFGTVAAVVAPLVLALTPITAAVARDNLPDTMMVLLLVGGAWGTLNALQSGRLQPLLIGAALVGLAFNTKMLQAYVVVPAFVLTYFVLAPGTLRRRFVHLIAAGSVLALVSASWMVVIDAIPASARPFIGGSTNNTVVDLVLGYNGLGRILGNDGVLGSTGEFGGGPGGPGFGGQPGILRLFNAQIGGQIAWLLPLAALALLGGLIARWRQPRTDVARSWYVLWGAWLATHFVVFSFAEGTFHPYYTSAIAPAIAALVGPGLVDLWDLYRRSWRTAWLLPTALGASAAVGFILLGRSEWLPWLRWIVVGAIAAAITGLLVGRLVASVRGRQLARAALVAGLVAVLAGPTAWVSTVLGSGQGGMNSVNPLAGPADANWSGFGGGPPPSLGADFAPGNGARGNQARRGVAGQPGGLPSVGSTGASGAPNPSSLGSGMPSGAPGGFGGPPGSRLADALIAYLQENRGSAAYLVAVDSANAAAPIILTTKQPVLAMGGFSGRDPVPTVPQLGELVASGQLRFVLGGGRGGPGGRGSFGGGGGERGQWLQANCTLVDPAAYGGLSGQQLYDCATPVNPAS
ncbi:MAG: glycosyltransferase family 39 protein [Chloroflexi bacterium]|nr:glycosyltransferase family 39 protein [Chloroflexota bacterium]